jgi:hypothetical protein
MATVWRGSAWLSSNRYCSGRPLTPPLLLISSSARSKPFFHCAPYCAFGPVSGPLTPSKIGSPFGSSAREAGVNATESAIESRTRRVRDSDARMEALERD